jgi:hypothetical protein
MILFCSRKVFVVFISSTSKLMTGWFTSFPNSMFTEQNDDNTFTSYGNSTLSLGPPLSQASHRNLMPAQQMANGEAGYLHTPSTQQLYQNWQCASETSNRMTVLYQESLQENTELRSKIRDLEAQLATQQFHRNLYASGM